MSASDNLTVAQRLERIGQLLARAAELGELIERQHALETLVTELGDGLAEIMARQEFLCVEIDRAMAALDFERAAQLYEDMARWLRDGAAMRRRAVEIEAMQHQLEEAKRVACAGNAI